MPGVTATTAARPLLRLRRPRPPGHLRDRPEQLPEGHLAARLLLPRRHREPDDEPACSRRRDGILVSLETITDYSLKPGRPAEASGPRPAHRPLPRRPLPRRRHRPGVPLGAARLVHGRQPRATSVASTHAPGPNVVFAKTSGDPRAVAPQVAAATRSVRAPGQEPRRADRADRDLDHDGRPVRDQPHRGGVRGGARRPRRWRSSCDRRSPSAATSSRRWRRSARRCARSPRSSGARPASCWAPALLLAAGLGWLLAQMLVAMLTHVFDPPPDHLAIPWGFLAALGGRRRAWRCSSPRRWRAAAAPPAAGRDPCASVEASGPGGGILSHAGSTRTGGRGRRRSAASAPARPRRGGLRGRAGRHAEARRSPPRRRTRRTCWSSTSACPTPTGATSVRRCARRASTPRSSSSPPATRSPTASSGLQRRRRRLPDQAVRRSPSSSLGSGAAAPRGADGATTVGDLRLDPATHAAACGEQPSR